jgi:hypothetical protein
MTKRGRPSTYEPAVAAEICRRMADGESLRSVCRDEGMPAASTVRGWVIEDINGFAEQYTRARMLLAEHWADEVLEVSDDLPAMTGEGKYDSASVQHQRLRVDSRKWLLSKVLPKVYGDKLDVTSDGKQVGLNIAIDLTDTKGKAA